MWTFLQEKSLIIMVSFRCQYEYGNRYNYYYPEFRVIEQAQ